MLNRDTRIEAKTFSAGMEVKCFDLTLSMRGSKYTYIGYEIIKRQASKLIEEIEKVSGEERAKRL